MMAGGRNLTDELIPREIDATQPYALRSEERKQQLGEQFRERPETSPLEFRLEYHRDRDRILWSTAFRRLQHKTQIFPHYVEDHYRRRLTHSLEVAQIATTLCRALGLNEVAAEAMALGHDLGHAPFGHGGEIAINKKLIDMVPRRPVSEGDSLRDAADTEPDWDCVFATQVPLYGFDHTAQGVEQVSRISPDYDPTLGLNLTFDVREGILKHIYSRQESDAAKLRRPFSSLANIVKLPKYAQYGADCGSLEAQCVWIADKIGYLLGDLEDAVRARILSAADVDGSKLRTTLEDEFHARRPKDTWPGIDEKNNDAAAFNRAALTVFILDCVDESKKRIKDAQVASLKDVREYGRRLIRVLDSLWNAWQKFYKEVVELKVFANANVEACNFKARKIVGDLFDAYWSDDKLIPNQYRERTQRAYAGLLDGDDQFRLMAVRNYLAGMTDSFATEQHKRLFMSSERAGSF